MMNGLPSAFASPLVAPLKRPASAPYSSARECSSQGPSCSHFGQSLGGVSGTAPSSRRRPGARLRAAPPAPPPPAPRVGGRRVFSRHGPRPPAHGLVEQLSQAHGADPAGVALAAAFG